MNWCRSLDHIHVIRIVSRNVNYGINGSGNETDPVVLLGLPSPEALFNVVWKLVPDFVRAKILQWAKSKMDGAIANEITSYVKRALEMIHVPALFANAVTNLVIPPLVNHIIASPVGPIFIFPQNWAN